MASSGFRHCYSFAGFVLRILSHKNCLILFICGDSFWFLKDVFHKEVLYENGEMMDKLPVIYDYFQVSRDLNSFIWLEI